MGLFDKFLKKKVKDGEAAASTGDATSPGASIPAELSASDATSPGTSVPGGQTSTDESKKKQRQMRIAILGVGLIAIILLFDEPQQQETTDSSTASEETSVNSNEEGKSSRRIGKKEKNKMAQNEAQPETPPEIENKEKIESPGIAEPEQAKIDMPSPAAEVVKQEEPALASPSAETAINATDDKKLETKIDEKSEGKGKGKAIASVDDESQPAEDDAALEQVDNTAKNESEDQGQDQPATNPEASVEKSVEEDPATVLKNESDGLLDKLEQEMKQDESKRPTANSSGSSNLETPEVKPLSLEEADYEYYGRGLVYNCQGEHWACVDQTIYQKCSGIEQFSKTQNSGSECATISVFESDADCARAQTEKINDLVEAPNACQGKY